MRMKREMVSLLGRFMRNELLILQNKGFLRVFAEKPKSKNNSKNNGFHSSRSIRHQARKLKRFLQRISPALHPILPITAALNRCTNPTNRSGSVFHFDPAASDVGVHVKILPAELFEVLGLGRLLFPIEPVSPAKSRDLGHGQPPVALFRFNHFLTQLDEQLGQIDLPGLAIIVELGDLVVRIDRLNWQGEFGCDDALAVVRIFRWAWNWFGITGVLALISVPADFTS